MKKLIFFGLLSFLLAAIWLTPLAFVTPHLSKLSNNVIVKEPSGTIWNGEVAHLTVNNNYLGKATWNVDPLQSIKSLALTTKFTLNSDDINANGTAGINLKQNVIIDNTQFDVNAVYLNSLQSNATLTGNISGFINKALLQKKTVPNINGIVNWQNGAIQLHVKQWAPFGNFKLNEGDYRAVISPANEDLDIKLSSKEAPIELNGDIKLQKDWIFNTNLISKSNNAGLMAMMKFAGKPQSDGSILIQQTGDLKPFIGID